MQTLMVALITVVVAMLVAGLIRSLTWLTDKFNAKPVASVAATDTAAAQTDKVPPQIVAAISAALSTVIGAHRIVHVGRVRHGHSWVGEGRSQHHSSHNIHLRHHRRS